MKSPNSKYVKFNHELSDIRKYFNSPVKFPIKQKDFVFKELINEWNIDSSKNIYKREIKHQNLLPVTDNDNDKVPQISCIQEFKNTEEFVENVLHDISIPQSGLGVQIIHGAPKGLKNYGNTCYVNSVVQSLFSLNFFIDALKECFNKFKEKFGEVVNEKLPILTLLIELHDKVKNSTSNELEKYLRGFKTYIGQNVDSQFANNHQQDAEEFLTAILFNLKEEIETNAADSFSISNPVLQFQYKLAREKLCTKCDKQDSFEYQETTVIHLQLTSDRHIQSAFLSFLEDETCSSICKDCSEKHILQKYFKRLPKVLFFQSGRCLSSFQKDTNDVDAPLNIYLPRKYIKGNLNTPLSTKYKSRYVSFTFQNYLH